MSRPRTSRGGAATERQAATPIITPQTFPAVSGGGGGGGDAAAGSPIEHDYGTLHMKAYPIDEFQLEDLARIGTAAAFCFSLAGACIGFGINLYKDLAIATGVSPEVALTWGIIRYVSFAIGTMFAVIGLYFFRTGHRRVENIKIRTTFAGQEPYQPKSLIPLALKFAMIIGLILIGIFVGKYLL